MIFSNRAQAYIKTNQLEEAYGDCTRGLAMDSKLCKLYVRRATAAKMQGNIDQAIQDIRQVHVLLCRPVRWSCVVA